MKLPGKNPGYGNRGKTNRVFPPFPQPLLLIINQDEKRPTPKQSTIVYTKYLTLPLRAIARKLRRLVYIVAILSEPFACYVTLLVRKQIVPLGSENNRFNKLSRVAFAHITRCIHQKHLKHEVSTCSFVATLVSYHH